MQHVKPCVFQVRLVIARSDAVQFPPTYDSNLIEREGKRLEKTLWVGWLWSVSHSVCITALQYSRTVSYWRSETKHVVGKDNSCSFSKSVTMSCLVCLPWIVKQKIIGNIRVGGIIVQSNFILRGQRWGEAQGWCSKHTTISSVLSKSNHVWDS